MQVQSGETPVGSTCHPHTGLGVPGSLTHFSACLSKVALRQVPDRGSGGPSRRAHGPGFTYLPARESVSAAAAAKACSLRLRPSGEGAKLVEEEAPGAASDQQA